MKKGERARLVSIESLASLKSAVAQICPERDPVVSKDNNVVIDFRDNVVIDFRDSNNHTHKFEYPRRFHMAEGLES